MRSVAAVLAVILLACLAPPACAEAARPPVAPDWVFRHWVWEDEEHTEEALLALVDDYESRGIDVGAVIIDSPWQAVDGDWTFNKSRYPDPERLVRTLHERDVRVVLWITAFVNPNSQNFAEACEAGYLLSDCKLFDWWRGQGAVVDLFDPGAAAWYFAKLRPLVEIGVDGWKVDTTDSRVDAVLNSSVGSRTREEFKEVYYRSFHEFASLHGGVSFARHFEAAAGEAFAPVDASAVGWTGDQFPRWRDRGLDAAIASQLRSAELGYAVTGSDIGGFIDGPRNATLLVRWAQLMAVSPLMENGGRGEHRPWAFGPEALEAYRRAAEIHAALGPTFADLMFEANATGNRVLRNISGEERWTLGDDVLVAPLREDGSVRVDLPPGPWRDAWDEARVVGTVVERTYPLERFPLFLREGRLIPLRVAGDAFGLTSAAPEGSLVMLLAGDVPERHVERILWHERGQARVEVDLVADRLEVAADGLAEPTFLVARGESAAAGEVLLGGRRVVVEPQPPADGDGAAAYRTARGDLVVRLWPLPEEQIAEVPPALLILVAVLVAGRLRPRVPRHN